MSEPRLPANLSNHHLRTLDQLFEHPVPHNIEWPRVLVLLEALGTVAERHDGKYAIEVDGHTEVIQRSPGKDLTEEQVVRIRRLLSAAGLGPVDRSDRV
jgi:hypothetical protein